MKSLEERRAAWLAYMDTLPWGKGEFDHSGWFSLLRAGSCEIPQSEAFETVTARIRAAGGVAPASRLTSQTRRAYAFAASSPSTGSSWRPREEYQPKKEKPQFDDTKLKAFAEEWAAHVNERWLGNRSAVDPATVGAGEFLAALYEPGEQVLLFSIFASQGQMFWVGAPAGGKGWRVVGCEYGHDYSDKFAEKLSGQEGVWFLAQPVDGLSHPNPRSPTDDGTVKLSRRSMESVTSWRYMVIESDQAAAADWLGAIVQLPLRIVAIYTSGGKSIHALVRVDAVSKSHWDQLRDEVLPILVTLGADPAALTAVRLTRLPGCTRAGKRQRLLYLNAKAAAQTARPICAIAPKRNVAADWERWAESAFSTELDPEEGDAAAQEKWQRQVRMALEHYRLAMPAERQT
jgi:hypothetical protein